jgi:hypothetical protein
LEDGLMNWTHILAYANESMVTNLGLSRVQYRAVCLSVAQHMPNLSFDDVERIRARLK